MNTVRYDPAYYQSIARAEKKVVDDLREKLERYRLIITDIVDARDACTQYVSVSTVIDFDKAMEAARSVLLDEPLNE